MQQKLLYIVCEGPTEKSLIKNVLALYLINFNVIPINLDGRLNYQRFKNTTKNLLKQNNTPYVTSLIDLFKLDTTFPEFTQATLLKNADEKVQRLEAAIHKDVVSAFEDLNPQRFFPYIQKHEFEALLFCDLTLFDSHFSQQSNNQKSISQVLQQSIQNTKPEDINGKNPPSYRLLAHVKGYDKVTDGTSIANGLGISTIRKNCPRFDKWLCHLESIC